MWEEGQTTLDLDTLLSNCENKYKIAVQTGVWKAPSKAAEQFAAMTAEWKMKHGSPSSTTSGGTPKSKEKLTYAERMKRDIESNPWKIIAPEEGGPQTKVMKGTTFKWCATHKKWMGHSTAECQGIGANIRRGNNNRNVAYEANVGNDNASRASALTEATTATPMVQVNSAMMSLAKNGYGLFE